MKPFEYLGLCLTELFKMKNDIDRMSKTLALIPQFEFLTFQLNRLIEEFESAIVVFEGVAQIERKDPRPYAEERFSDEHMYFIKCRGNLVDIARKIVKMMEEFKIIGQIGGTEKYDILINKLDNLLRSVVSVVVDFDEANVEKMQEKDYLPMAEQLEKETKIEKQKMKEIDEKQLALRSVPSHGAEEDDEEEDSPYGLSQGPKGVSGPPVKKIKQLKKKQPKAENKMNIDSLIALADKLDEAGQEEEANRIDEMIKEIEKNKVELPPIDVNKVNFDEECTKCDAAIEENKNAFISVAFEKLASIADKLDEIGAPEEANLIDAFLSKYANIKETQLDDIRDTITRHVAWFINPENNDENKMTYDLDTIIELLHKYRDLCGPKQEGIIESASAEIAKEAAPKKSENVDPYDSKKHHEMQVRQPEKGKKEVKEHHVAPYQAHNSTLSIRHCPVHIGVSLARIGEHTYQCSLDGEIFNWENGWTGADGEVHPGGSVAAQTPQSTEYAIPSRIFDSREKVLDKASY